MNVCFLVRNHSPGALIAGTWAAMQYIGSEYVYLNTKLVHLCLLYSLTRSIADTSNPVAPS